jgi:hypothetical protein
MVVLTAYLIFRGSPESKDGDDEMKQSLARLEHRLDALTHDQTTVNGPEIRKARIDPMPNRMAGDLRR